MPKRPVDAYEQLIDQLVESSSSLGAKLIETQQIFSRAIDAAELNEMVSSLDERQRSLLAEMLGRERRSATHDVLATLTWWIDSRGVGLTYCGEKMPVQLSGMGLHGDYIGRLEGWEWPTDSGEA